MKLWRWILPVTAGTCAGWLAARARIPDAPEKPRAVNPSPAVPHTLPGQRNKVLASASSPDSPDGGPAAALADRELAAAEALIARIAEAGPEELKALLKEVGSGFGGSVAQLLARVAYRQRWVELDAAGGLEWMMRKDDWAAGELLAAWLRMDTAGATAWAKDHQHVRPWVSLHIGSEADEYAAIIRASLAQPLAFGKPNESYKLEMLAQLDPAAAQAILQSLPAEDPRRMAVAGQIATGMAAHDPAAALAWLRSLSAGDGPGDAITNTLRRVALTHPEFVMEELASGRLTESQVARLRDDVATGLAGRDPRALREWLATLPDNGITAGTASGIQRMKAGTMSLTEMHGIMTEMELAGVNLSDYSSLWNWTGRDPAAELLNAAALPEDATRAKLMASLKQAAMVSGALPDPHKVAALPDSIRAEIASDFAAVAETLGDSVQADAWRKLMPPAAIVGKLNKPLEGYYAPPAEQTLSLYAQLPSAHQAECTAGVAEKVARSSPDQALEWMQTLPPEQQVLTWEGIAAGLARRDEASAEEWVQSLPDDASRDGAVSALSARLVESDPAGALEWALSIHDDEGRHAALGEITEKWMSDEPDAAAAVLRAMDLSPEERAVVEQSLSRNP